MRLQEATVCSRFEFCCDYCQRPKCRCFGIFGGFNFPIALDEGLKKISMIWKVHHTQYVYRIFVRLHYNYNKV